MLTICKITKDDRPALRAMAEAYWREIFTRSPVVLDPAYRARYFEGHFPRQSDHVYQWWAKAGADCTDFMKAGSSSACAAGRCLGTSV